MRASPVPVLMVRMTETAGAKRVSEGE
jgi:hypothetical protein